MTSSDDQSYLDDAIFRVGEVIAIQGRVVRIRVDKAKNGSHLLYKGKLLRNVSVGGYLKITKGFSEIIAKVDGEVVGEAPEEPGYRSQQDRVNRVLTVSLIGFFTADSFRRGVRELPLVGNECYLLTDAEFDTLHSFVTPGDTPLTIGKLAMEKEQFIRVGVTALFASHIGIFGNTGSGKSYTLAKIYRELFELYRSSARFKASARFVLIDFNGEYVNAERVDPDHPHCSVIADGSLKTEYVLTTRTDHGVRLPFTKDALEDPTIWTVLLDATEKTQAPFLHRTLQSDRWDSRLNDPVELALAIGGIVYAAIKSSDATLEKGLIIKFLQEIQGCFGDEGAEEFSEYIENMQVNLGYHNVNRCFYFRSSARGNVYASEPGNDQFFRELTSERLTRLPIDLASLQSVDRIRLKIVLQYYSDIFHGYANREHLGPLIKRLESRIPQIKRVLEVSEQPLLANALTVISLRDVNLDMKKVLPLLICRQLYDEKKAQAGPGGLLNIIIDEAHTILSDSSKRESEAWKDYRLETFEEIVKEGRKFGVFLTIASQRPHDISETIISQLHNYFLHRLVNNLDILAVERAVSYLDRVSFESLPILPTGSCVVSGVSTQVPLVVDIDPMPPCHAPNSATMTLADRWSAAAVGEEEAVPAATPDWALDEPPW